MRSLPTAAAGSRRALAAARCSPWPACSPPSPSLPLDLHRNPAPPRLGDDYVARAIALTERAAAAAREALLSAGAAHDRELAFWLAEIDYRAGHYATARDEYRALLAEPADAFRGRIYDHDSLAKVYALKGDHAKAKELYARLLQKAGPARRLMRRAALGFLQWIDGDRAATAATVAPCLPGGEDATARRARGRSNGA